MILGCTKLLLTEIWLPLARDTLTTQEPCRPILARSPRVRKTQWHSFVPLKKGVLRLALISLLIPRKSGPPLSPSYGLKGELEAVQFMVQLRSSKLPVEQNTQQSLFRPITEGFLIIPLNISLYGLAVLIYRANALLPTLPRPLPSLVY